MQTVQWDVSKIRAMEHMEPTTSRCPGRFHCGVASNQFDGNPPTRMPDASLGPVLHELFWRHFPGSVSSQWLAGRISSKTVG